MNNAIFNFSESQNEPVLSYISGGGGKEINRRRADLTVRQKNDIPLIIGGKESRTGKTGKIIMPSNHSHVLATFHQTTEKEVTIAINSTLEAKNDWMTLAWVERAAIMAKSAEFISKKYRYQLNAATMLGQGKNLFQVEINSTCEVTDYIRFNNYFASLIYMEQPKSEKTKTS